ncbi:MAG: PPC domain-containing protein [Kofleriaceae bacterium]
MANRTRILTSLLFLAAACGDDGPSNNDGGNGDGGGTCSTAPLTIATVPGMVMGTVKGKGADLNSPEGSCTEEYGYFEPTGEDEIVAINGLVPGMRYGLTLQSMSDDLSLYVTANCPPATGMVTSCTTFTDEAIVFFTNDPEVITFTATAATHYVVVDTGIEMLEDGNFTLAIEPATCGPQTEMADCTGGTPYCLDFGCVQCVSGFDCSAAAMPACSAEGSCIAGPMQCTGDDTRDGGNGDDGPTVASMIGAPTAGNPVTTTGNICSSPAAEQDWFTVTLDRNVSIALEFTGASNDLDLYLLNAQGQIVERAEENAGINEAILTSDIMASGTYYVVVTQYAPMNTTAAVGYTLRLEIPECDPAAWPLPACGNAATPVCNAQGRCAVGPATCVDDDAGEPNDDGPAGARLLTSGVGVTSKACTVAGEFDWYRFVAVNGGGATISVDWPTVGKDFDLQVVDSAGKVYGFTLNAKPEVITLTNLPAGTYYVRVQNYAAQGATASDEYTITATIAATSTACSTNLCSAEYKTQIYRGTCTTATNVCSFIPDSDNVAVGGACDSDGDCTGTAVCSYATFQSNAHKSRCGPMTCATSADCLAAGADFKCTTFGSGNTCMPSCLGNTDCGANNGSTFEPDHPWDYFTCAVAAGTCGM